MEVHCYGRNLSVSSVSSLTSIGMDVQQFEKESREQIERLTEKDNGKTYENCGGSCHGDRTDRLWRGRKRGKRWIRAGHKD